jgi:exosortase/archaeosortase family protein
MIGFSAFAAIFLNIARNTYLAIYVNSHGAKAIDQDYAGLEPGQAGFSFLGTVHDFAGNAAMVATFVVLIACVPLLNRLGSSRVKA